MSTEKPSRASRLFPYLTGIWMLWVCLAPQALGAAEPFTRTEDVIYGRKFGTALTMDVFRPEQANGCAVILVVSGGFFSAKEAINPAFCQPFLNRGYTVFAVVHGSQPRFIIPEIQADLHRAVRFIRSHAERWNLQPDKFGVTGASAGGHLSLTLATQGKPGPAEARDPVDRESSAVQAAACFFPPTDLLNYGKPGEDAVGVGILAGFKAAFGPRADTAESRQTYGREISPLYFVTSAMAPALIIHGDADRLVPFQQAELFVERAQSKGATAKLVRRAGKDHGWGIEMLADLEIFADWFDEHLRGIKK